MPGFDPDKILEAMMDTPPKFNRDGYVEVVETAYVFGTPMIRYENWGSFMPDKDGKDLMQTIVPAGVTLNEKVMKMQEEGICEVTESSNGNRVVTYKGIDRGAYLSLGDLQQATIHILTVIKNSAAMKKLMDRANI
jgi:beta-glucosidase